jgi:uncharacterized membrane protein
VGADVTIVIAVILGGAFGALIGQGTGAVAGALLGWLVFRSVRQQRHLDALQKALAAVQAAPPAIAVPATAERAADEGIDVPLEPVAPSGIDLDLDRDLQPASRQPAAPEEVDLVFDAHPDSAPAVPRTEAPVPNPPRTPSPAWGALRAWLFGGNTIVKVGIGILFIGLAFLAKFASEHVHVPVEFRLASIAGVALLLLGIGWRLRLRRAGYAQALQGGAIAVLYLTLFVAFRFYGVLSAPPVFALMVLVAALAAALAVLQDARALAVIGALGGFATPLLVSTGSGNHIALFSYYLVLDLGIAAVAWHKTWRSLNLVGFFGTFIVATAWGALKYTRENFASSEAFLIAFFLLFVVIMVLPARRALAPDATAPHRIDGWVNSSLLFGLPTIVFALQYGLVRHIEYATALSALVMAAFYVGLARWMRARPQLGLTFDASIAIGTVFLTLVIPFALDARSTAGAWALEGAGLVWIGLRQRRLMARAFGYLLMLLAGFSMLYAHERHGVPITIFNAYLFNGLMAAAASWAAAFFVQRHAERVALHPSEAVAEPLLIGLGTLWLVSAAALEIETFVPARFRLAAWLASISAIAGLCVLLSVRLAWQRIAWPAVGQAPFMALTALATAGALASPVHGGGWWAWPLAFVVHAAVLWFIAPRWPEPLRHALHAVGALVLGAIGALQGRAATASWGDAASAWPWLGWLVVPALLLIALPRPGTARRWPVVAEPGAYQATAAAVIAVGLVLWTLIANVASDGTARPLPALPLLNPLDIGIGIALAAVWVWTRSAAVAPHLVDRQRGVHAALAVAAFVWLNAILVRAFHHHAGVPYRFDAWTASLAVQTGITLLWTATALALMWFSAHRAARTVWMVGAALLAAVVLKLLLVDLSGSGTVTRIISFIGVGVLMLVIGYVAPLPAKGDRHAVV